MTFSGSLSISSQANWSHLVGSLLVISPDHAVALRKKSMRSSVDLRCMTPTTRRSSGAISMPASWRASRRIAAVTSSPPSRWPAMLLVALEVVIAKTDDVLPVHEGVESHRRAREVDPDISGPLLRLRNVDQHVIIGHRFSRRFGQRCRQVELQLTTLVRPVVER